MKRFWMALIFLIIAISLPSITYSTEIDLLSSDYRIWGNVHASYMGTEVYEEYDLRSSHPISHYVTFAEEYPVHGGWYRAESKTEQFCESVYASSMFGAGWHSGSGNDAFANAVWEFKTPNNNLKIIFDWIYEDPRSYGYSFSNIWLNDITTNEELLYFRTKPMNLPSSLNGSYIFEGNFDPNHIYSLRMYSEAESADDIIGYSICAKFCVPEPSTTLLISVGLIGLFGINRKVRNNLKLK